MYTCNDTIDVPSLTFVLYTTCCCAHLVSGWRKEDLNADPEMAGQGFAQDVEETYEVAWEEGPVGPCVETEEVAVRENWVVKETCLQMDVMGKLLEEQGEHWILVMTVQWESFPQNPSP